MPTGDWTKVRVSPFGYVELGTPQKTRGDQDVQHTGTPKADTSPPVPVTPPAQNLSAEIRNLRQLGIMTEPVSAQMQHLDTPPPSANSPRTVFGLRARTLDGEAPATIQDLRQAAQHLLTGLFHEVPGCTRLTLSERDDLRLYQHEPTAYQVQDLVGRGQFRDALARYHTMGVEFMRELQKRFFDTPFARAMMDRFIQLDQVLETLVKSQPLDSCTASGALHMCFERFYSDASQHLGDQGWHTFSLLEAKALMQRAWELVESGHAAKARLLLRDMGFSQQLRNAGHTQYAQELDKRRDALMLHLQRYAGLPNLPNGDDQFAPQLAALDALCAKLQQRAGARIRSMPLGLMDKMDRLEKARLYLRQAEPDYALLSMDGVRQSLPGQLAQCGQDDLAQEVFQELTALYNSTREAAQQRSS